MSLRIRAEEKTLLLRAVALEHTDLTDFVIRHALRAAKAVIEEADHVQLSARNSLRVLDLLENPPAPNARLRAAAKTSGAAIAVAWYEEAGKKQISRKAEASKKNLLFSWRALRLGERQKFFVRFSRVLRLRLRVAAEWRR
jgi:uncharacterized protein (DUF1778 family)